MGPIQSRRVVAEASPATRLDELAAIGVGLRLALAAPGVVERAARVPHRWLPVDPVAVDVCPAAAIDARTRRVFSVRGALTSTV